MTTRNQSYSHDDSSFYTNQQLFSDYYLRERMVNHHEWNADGDALSQAFHKALLIYENTKASLDKANEAQTEDDFIKPMFREVLEFYYDVQPTATLQGKRNRPDYVLFTEERKAKAAKEVRGREDEYYSHADLIADAKYWKRPLDTAGDAGREELSNANPSFQIINYLVATGAEWGVLTNGAIWRLYSTRARSRVDTYYEVDLAGILEARDLDAFRYLYFFFRRGAFIHDPHTNQTFIEAVHEGSVNYGVSLQQHLKDLIFDEVFRLLAAGFLKGMGEKDPNQGLLDDIFEGTLRLLYRLLFLLHAESRDLLPVTESAYADYSLLKLQRKVAEELDSGKTLSSVSADLWNDLKSLFRIIDQGDPDLNIPRYNGSLFRKEESRNIFLESQSIPDKYLYPALILLTRETDAVSGQSRFIDYKDLDVEQLGSIYEGLLEFRLKFDPENSSKLDASGLGISLLLLNDKGERKATGSYYTPHYIVEQIVDNTLSPVLKEREATFRELMSEILRIRESHADRELADLENQAVEALLSIRVCDPAMGSGHFLVEAADWLAEHIIALLNEYPEDPIQKRLADSRDHILEELEREGISIPSEKLKDTNLLKRMVMKRCIYGVDLNPMAVELAKLSLWLDSFTVGAPLSFLDHHLKVGNSLIGVWELERYITEGSDRWSDIIRTLGNIVKISELTDSTIDEARESYRLFRESRKWIKPTIARLNVSVASSFEDIGDTKRAEQIAYIPEEDYLADDAVSIEKFQISQRIADEKNFFHWKLEFPEVFVDLENSTWKDKPGFDAIVGNPPYVRGRVLPVDDKRYFNSKFSSAFKSYDLYVLFIEHGIKFLRDHGYWSMIIPRSLLTESYGEEIRKLVLDKTQICGIYDYLGIKIFSDASVINCIPVLKKQSDVEDISQNEVIIQCIMDDDRYPIKQDIFTQTPQFTFRLELKPRIVEILRKLDRHTFNLGEVCYISYSIAAHSEVEDKGKDAYIHDRRISEKCRPFIEGKEIDRFLINWQGRYLEYDPSILRRPSLPDLFENPKITVVGISGEEGITAAFDEGIYYVGYPAICLTTKYHLRNVSRSDIHFSEDEIKISKKYQLFYLLSIMNSTLMKFYFDAMIFSTSQTIYSDDIRELPIREIDFITPPDEISELLEKSFALYDEAVRQHDVKCFLDFFDKQLLENPEASDVFHSILSSLSRKMIELKHRLVTLENALDPFKYIDQGVEFLPLLEVFSKEIKYGERISDLGTVHHDIDGFRLIRLEDSECWQLDLQLKLRNPSKNWQEWQYEEGGNYIKREWIPVYRFVMEEAKAFYYHYALQVRDQFTQAGSLPGGYTRTTMRKLEVSEVPTYETEVDPVPLIELGQELIEVREHIQLTDDLIDQIVYKIYGLSEEEIAIVERKKEGLAI